MSDVPLRPDDITLDEEYCAVTAEGTLRRALAAQNALRDRRVREDERERIAQMLGELYERDDMTMNREEAERWLSVITTLREGGQR